MKIKEVDRTANVAWSPASQHPIYLAAGTAAQQLDATFSTSASLDIFALNLTEPGLDMTLKGSLALDHRFNKITWGGHGMDNGDHASGVIVGGTDSGNLLVYDPAKLIDGDVAEVFQSDKHTGPIFSLDFNHFQSNLLVSGGGDSEILIWDLANPGSPMTPGAKSQPSEEVSCVAWNRQVQHILASTFPARCVVWDLRKNEPIIKVSDSAARLRCKVVAWHPEVATQLCIASEDDHCPVIQLWDLRFATSPLKTLESHQRGILSIAWCQHDPDLLLSCGKDNRILCWNPNSTVTGGEVVCELPTNNQWSFEVAWCPRNPAVIVSSSFDGHVSVYSLMGGQQQTQPSSKIAESFPGADAFAQPPVSQTGNKTMSMPLQKPPKWLRRPVGAVFGFGGKLVSFGIDTKSSNPNAAPLINHTVDISQVITEPIIVENASSLDQVLKSGNLAQFCQKKINETSEPHQKMTWSFLNASFEPSPRSTMLSLLGYDPQQIAIQLKPLIKDIKNSDLNEELNGLDIKEKNDLEDSTAFDEIATDNKLDMFQIKTDDEESSSVLARALLTGNIEAAVCLCIQEGNWADALVLAQAGGQDLMASTQKKYLTTVVSNTAQLISAVVTSDWDRVVKNCDLDCWKESLAAVLTYAKPEEFPILCETLGRRLEKERNGVSIQHAILCYICAGNLESLTHCWLRTNDSNLTSHALQDLVEQIMVLKKTVELLGGQAMTPKTGALSRLLGKYVVLLASQGSLALASTFISDASENSLKVLKDRITTALGTAPQAPYQKINAVTAVPNIQRQIDPNPQRMAAHSQAQPQHQTNQYQQPQSIYNPHLSNAAAPQAPSSYDFYNPAVAHTQNLSSSLPNAAMFPPHVPPHSTPTPPPPSSGIDPSGPVKSHMSQRYPRHVQDSSVYSEPGYGSQTMYGQQSYGFNPQPVQANNSFGQQRDFVHSQAPAQSYFSLEPNGQNSMNQPSPFNLPTPQQNSFVPSVPPTFAPARQPYPESNPGWNDPPPLKASHKKHSAPTFEQNPHLMNPLVAEPIGVPPASGYGAMNFSIPQQPAIPIMQPTQPQAPPSPALQQITPEPPKEKGPIPPEHQVLQDIFEDLRQQCHQAATNPQIRRKLDDVARKLENLYDKIRENGLSANTTLGLHQIVQMIQQGDYQSTLAIHTQLVATTNFAETSSFMLGLKVLLQTAQQLGVYLR